MQVSPITRSNFVNYNNSKAKNASGFNVNFGHHPDFKKLMQDYEVTASSYFRRGSFYGSPCKEFADVISTLKQFFNEKMNLQNGKINMLIGGIGNSEEPFSMLAVIKNLIGENKIKDVLNLFTVDLQSRPEKKELKWQSFYSGLKPDFVPDSFVKETSDEYGYKWVGKYRVCDEIFQYLSEAYDNHANSKWETRIQDAVKEYPDNSLDIVSINNTIGYIMDYEEGMSVLRNVLRSLKSGGVFITDPDYRKFRQIFSPEVSDEIYPGIYKKK